METIIYTKYSRERQERFQISTAIVEDEKGNRKVRKKALHPEAEEHVLAMAKNASRLLPLYEKSNLLVCPCEKRNDNSVEFAYIKGKNMDQLLTEHIEQGDFEKVRQDIRFLWDILSKAPDLAPFTKSQEFCQVFGNLSLPEGLLATPLSNLDMVFSNILVAEQYVLTDYEWVFDFMIPISFLFARSLFLHGKFQTLPKEKQAELYKIGGVTLEQVPLYHQMEVNFQKYVTGKEELYVLSKLYPSLGTHAYFLKNWDTEAENFSVEFFGVPKEKPDMLVPLFYRRNKKTQNQVAEEIQIADTSRYSQFLLKPTDSNGAILEFRLLEGKRAGEKDELKFSSHNARLNQGKEYLFQEKPQFIIPNNGYEQIRFSYVIHHQKNFLVNEEIEFRAENARLQEELAKYTGRLHRRALRKMKKILKGNK